MTDQDVIETLHRIVGVGTVVWQHAPAQKKINAKPRWNWRVSGKKAEELMWKMLPYLGERRRAKFAELLLILRE
jgi:hypothetical protein